MQKDIRALGFTDLEFLLPSLQIGLLLDDLVVGVLIYFDLFYLVVRVSVDPVLVRGGCYPDLLRLFDFRVLLVHRSAFIELTRSNVQIFYHDVIAQLADKPNRVNIVVQVERLADAHFAFAVGAYAQHVIFRFVFELALNLPQRFQLLLVHVSVHRMLLLPLLWRVLRLALSSFLL